MKKNLYGIKAERIVAIIVAIMAALFISVYSGIQEHGEYIRGAEWVFAVLFGILQIKGSERICKYITSLSFVLLYTFLSHEFIEFLSYTHSRILYTIFTYCLGLWICKGELNSNRSKYKSFIKGLIVFLITMNFWAFSIVDITFAYSKILGILLLLLMYVWTSVFVDTCMWGASYLVNMVDRELEHVKIGKRVGLICFLLMFAIGVILSIVYYPGIFSPDVAGIYNCAKNFGDISLRSDVHSFMYVILEAILFRITDNYYILTLCMVFLFSVIWGKLMQFLAEQGGSTKSLILLSLIWISFPRNMWMMIATWKDVPFTICLALLLLLMTKWIFAPKDFDSKKSNYLMLTLSLFGIATFRSNGQVVLIGVVVLYLILFIKRKIGKKLLMSALYAMSALIIFKGPVFKFMQVSPTPVGYVSLPFLDGVWESAYKGNELSSETIKTIEEILPLEDFNEAYREAYVNYSAFPRGYIGLDTKAIFKAYLECARRYPFDTIIARMRKTYNIWAVFPHEKYILDTNYEQVIRDFTDIGGEEWHYIDKLEPIRQLFKALYIYPNDLSNVYFSLASCGFCIVIWLILLYVSFIYNEIKIMYLIYPIAVNTIALLIGCCYQDCCYTYPMIALTIPFVYIFFLYMCKEKESAVQSDITIL